MRRLALITLAWLSVFGAAVMAQTPATPSFVPVPDNALLSYNLNGLDVYNGGNEKVGVIQDEVIASGRLSGYILSVGGFLGLGERYIVIAPAGLIISFSAGDEKWHAKIDATKEQLKAAPEFKYEGRWRK